MEQLAAGRGGNLAQLARFSFGDHPRRGLIRGVRLLSHELSLTGSWWRGLGAFNPFSGDVPEASAWAVPVMLLPLGVVAVRAGQARDVPMLAGLVLTGAMVLSVVVGVGSIDGGIYPYLVRWAAVLGWWAATCLALALDGAIERLAPALRRRGRRSRVVAITVAIGIAAPIVIAGGLRSELAYGPLDGRIQTLADAVERSLDPDVAVQVGGSGGFDSLIASTGLLLDLEKKGWQATAPPDDALIVGSHRVRQGPDAVVLFVSVGTFTAQIPAIPSSVEIARVDELTPHERAACDRWGAIVIEAFAAGDQSTLDAAGPEPRCGQLLTVRRVERAASDP